MFSLLYFVLTAFYIEANISPIEKRSKIMDLDASNYNKCGWISTTAN
jgi:hypothetical protein